MTHQVSIFVDNKISASFVKANSFLIEKYKNIIDLETDKHTRLKQLWLDEYRAQLLDYSIVFNSDRDLTVFLLKWG
jgi:hypothetical protein